METYKLVREARYGRQSIGEEIHYIVPSEEKTKCGRLSVDEVCSVRTLGFIKGDVPVCQKCKDK